MFDIENNIRRKRFVNKSLSVIASANDLELDILLKAVLRRYAELYPQWEVSVTSVEKSVDKNLRLDRMIAMLESMKIPNDMEE